MLVSIVSIYRYRYQRAYVFSLESSPATVVASVRTTKKWLFFSHCPTLRVCMGVTQTSFLRYSQVRLFIPTRIPNLLMHCCPDSRNTASKASERISIRTDSDKDRSCTMFMVSIQTSEFVYNTHTTHSRILFQNTILSTISRVHIPWHLDQILDYKTSFFLE